MDLKYIICDVFDLFCIFLRFVMYLFVCMSNFNICDVKLGCYFDLGIWGLIWGYEWHSIQEKIKKKKKEKGIIWIARSLVPVGNNNRLF